MDAVALADMAERYIQRHGRLATRRRQLEERLFRVQQALLEWEHWEDEQSRPLHLRRPLPVPVLGYDSLKALRASLLDGLAELGPSTAEARRDR